MFIKKIKGNEETIDKFIFYFAIIDILFFPYIWFLSTNYSLPIVCVWILAKFKEIKNTKEFKISIILVIFMILSTVLSFIFYPKALVSGEEIWIQNIKMMIQYSSYLLYYMMFIYCIKKYDIKLKNIFLTFLAFAVILAVIYCINKNIFANIKSFWNNVDSYTIWFKEGKEIQYRYNFMWTDPNNPAYAFVALMAFMLLNIKTNIYEKIFISFSTILLLICSMSTGGVLSFILVLIAMFIFAFLPKIKEFKITKKGVITIISSILLIGLIIIFLMWQLKDNTIYKEAITRIIGNTDEGSSSRFDIWFRILSNKNIFGNILLGSGGRQVIMADGSIIAPHNGHLYFIYAYGMIFYLVFMYEFFRKRVSIKHYIFEIPIIIGFTINTMVGEQKFVILYLLLYAMSIIKNKQIKVSEKSEK